MAVTVTRDKGREGLDAHADRLPAPPLGNNAKSRSAFQVDLYLSLIHI